MITLFRFDCKFEIIAVKFCNVDAYTDTVVLNSVEIFTKPNVPDVELQKLFIKGAEQSVPSFELGQAKVGEILVQSFELASTLE